MSFPVWKKKKGRELLKIAPVLFQRLTGSVLCYRVSQCACSFVPELDSIWVGSRPNATTSAVGNSETNCPKLVPFVFLRAKQLKVVYWFSWQDTIQRENAKHISVLLFLCHITVSTPSCLYSSSFRDISSLSQKL